MLVSVILYKVKSVQKSKTFTQSRKGNAKKNFANLCVSATLRALLLVPA